MKTAVRIVTILLLLLLAVVLLSVMILGIQGKMPFFDGSWMKLRHTEPLHFQNIDTLQIDVSSYSVIIEEVSATEEPRLEVYSLAWGSYSSDEVSVSTKSNSLSVKQSARFSFSLFGINLRQLRLYLPAGWEGNLESTQSSGSLSINGSLTFKELKAALNSGSIRLGDITVEENAHLSASSGSIRAENLTAKNIVIKANSGTIHVESASADTIEAKATSGSIRFGALTGNFALEAGSGTVRIDAGAGSGSAKTTSGSVRVDMNEVTDDLSLSASSGTVRLTLPSDLSFSFQGQTGSGTLKTDFDSSLSYKGRNYAEGQVGSDGPHIECKVGSGSLSVALD